MCYFLKTNLSSLVLIKPMSNKDNNHFLLDESKCKKLTLTKFKKQFNFFDESVSFFLDLIQLTREDKDPKSQFSVQEGAILLLNLRIITSLYCANNLVKTGYYNESFVLQRSVHESLYLCKYLDKNPSSVKKWMKGESIQHNKISDDLKLSKEAKKLYDVFCDHAHPNLASILDLVVFKKQKIDSQNLQDQKITSVYLGSIFNEEMAYTSIIIELLLIQMSIDNFLIFFKNHNWIKDDNNTIQKRHDTLHRKYFKIFDAWCEYVH